MPPEAPEVKNAGRKSSTYFRNISKTVRAGDSRVLELAPTAVPLACGDRRPLLICPAPPDTIPPTNRACAIAMPPLSTLPNSAAAAAQAMSAKSR